MKTKSPTKFLFREELIDQIKKKLPLHSVYVISVQKEKRKREIFLPLKSTNPKKSVIYTLLIIGRKSPSRNLGDFMDDLYNKMQRRCRVYVIFYTLSKVKKRLNYGDNFLTQVIFHTSCIYKKDDSLLRFSNCPLFFHYSIYERIQQTWKNRMERAEYLLSTIGCIERKEYPISMLSTMQSALEQICLGLLYLFWEFKPQHYSLSYMLHLCNHFSEPSQNIFTRETYGLHRIYYMLCNAHQIMRFKAHNEFSEKDTDKAYNRCERFYDEAKRLGDKHLEYLKEQHCQPS